MDTAGLDLLGWHELDSEVRRITATWAQCNAEAGEKYADGTAKDYSALSDAASTDADTFVKQWANTIGDFTSVTEIADRLFEESVHFRKAHRLIDHAMIATRREIRRHSKALRQFDNYSDYEDAVLDTEGVRLVIDHAIYALYVAWRPNSKIIVPDNRSRLLKAIAIDESLMRVVSPRQFEELVAYLYECLGCRVELTPASRDFGADVLAWQPGPFGSETLTAVQVKKYASHRKVGIKGLFELHGAMAHYRARAGHLVTTSDFSAPAREFAETQQLHLVNMSAFQAEIDRLFVP